MRGSELSFVLLLSLVSGIHGVMPGGESEVPIDSPDIVRLSQVALVKLNEGRLKEEDNPRNLVEIVKASVQVVSGTLTRLTLKVTEGGAKKLCEVKIWEQPWLNRTEITHSECVDLKEEKRRSAMLEDDDVVLNTFNDFMKKYNKVYSDKKEFKKRYHIFRANLKKIKLLRETEQGTGEYGITKFADLTSKEFSRYLGLKVPENPDDLKELPKAEIPNIKLPDSFDWRHYNVVTPVKNQEMCGSCWAFSTVANVEGQWALKKGQLLSLSEQELVDCDNLDDGCGGGYMTTAYKSIMKLGGLETEEDYPYEGENERCQFDKTEIKAKISGAVNISSDEREIAQWVVKNGPVSVALNANAMQFYFGGVSHPIKALCSPESLDHGVAIVGFGTKTSRFRKKQIPYWIIKNSWGESWGEKGYYKLYRGDGTCGVNKMVSSAVVQ